MQQQPAVPPGFYPDPGGRPCLRWWDGGTWTSRTAPQPPQAPMPDPQPPQAPMPGPPPRPSKGSAWKWLVGIAAVLVLGAGGWLVTSAGAILGDANPVVLVMPGGEEVRRDDMGQVLDELATYVTMKAGEADSSQRWAFCDAIPAAFLEAGIEARYPAGEGAFVGACVRAR